MRQRAPSSGISLNRNDAAIVKGMLLRGDRQHDIAAWFGVNGGRIGEIATGKSFGYVHAAKPEDLPPAGPYPAGREAVAAIQALAQAKNAIALAEQQIKSTLCNQ